MKITSKDLKKIQRTYNSCCFIDKTEWVRVGRKLAKCIAESMGLSKDQFKITKNMAGDGSTASICLYTPTHFFNFESTCIGFNKFMWRTCERLGESGTNMKHQNKFSDIFDVAGDVTGFVNLIKGRN